LAGINPLLEAGIGLTAGEFRGLLRALARNADNRPSFPEYETILASASLVSLVSL
jgi:hypothetical protein